MSVNLAPGPFGVGGQFFSGNTPLNAGLIYTYAAGTSTPQPTFTTSAGNIQNANPIVLNVNGILPQEVWLTAGIAYKFIVTDSLGNVIFPYTMDNITGINDFSSIPTGQEWIETGLTPQFVNSTSFNLPGDQTGIFHANRRIKLQETAGTVYGTVTSSSVLSAVTTVNVTIDSGGSVDSGLSDVAYSILDSQNMSIPLISGPGIISAYTGGVLSFAAVPGLVSMVNGTLVTSVAGNAMTIALKTLLGADPSAANPVYFIFRDSTITTGGYVVRAVTAALSVVLLSTATLGTINATAARIYIAALDNAGTVVLAAYNSLSGTSLIGLQDDQLYTAVTPVANLAQTVYAGTAVTSKPLRVIGYIEATEATAGTWVTNASKVQLMGPGVKRTGDTIQSIRTSTGASTTGITVFPFNNTIPPNTAGDQYLAQAITPLSALNLLDIRSNIYVSNSVAQRQGMALFQDAVVNALVAAFGMVSAADFVAVIPLAYRVVAGTVVATTFKIRSGGQVAGTTTFNGNAGAGIYGGVLFSFLQIDEVMI